MQSVAGGRDGDAQGTSHDLAGRRRRPPRGSAPWDARNRGSGQSRRGRRRPRGPAARGPTRKPADRRLVGVSPGRAPRTGRAAHHSVRAPSPARAVAVRVLERVLSDAAFADLALEAELDRRALAPRDGALATEIVL